MTLGIGTSYGSVWRHLLITAATSVHWVIAWKRSVFFCDTLYNGRHVDLVRISLKRHHHFLIVSSCFVGLVSCLFLFIPRLFSLLFIYLFIYLDFILFHFIYQFILFRYLFALLYFSIFPIVYPTFSFFFHWNQRFMKKHKVSIQISRLGRWVSNNIWLFGKYCPILE